MEFRISDTFTDSLAKLTYQEQRAVKYVKLSTKCKKSIGLMPYENPLKTASFKESAAISKAYIQERLARA